MKIHEIVCEIHQQGNLILFFFFFFFFYLWETLYISVVSVTALGLGSQRFPQTMTQSLITLSYF